MMPLNPLFGGAWGGRCFSRWQTKEISDGGGQVCSPCPQPHKPGQRCWVGSWDRGGMQGRAASKDALAGLSPRTPCTRSPTHSPAATSSPPRIPPKTTPKPKSASYIYTGLASAPLLVPLFGDGVMVPQERPPGIWGKAFPAGTWGGCGDADPHPVLGRTMGLPRVSLLISCAASPSTGRPQRLWQPHLFTG